MKNITFQPFTIVLFLSLFITASGCKKILPSSNSSPAGLLSINVNRGEQIARSPSELKTFLASNDYDKGDGKRSYATNTKLLYSISYGIDEEAGQLAGKIAEDQTFVADGVGTTQQLVLSPGALGGMQGNGQTLFKVGDTADAERLSFATLLYRVATAFYARSSGELSPGYASMMASKVSFTASTAGESVEHQDAVEVQLSAPSSGSKALIYFCKGMGLCAVEFSETAEPSGTSKVYIGRQL